MPSPDQPLAGHYKMRLVRGGPWCPVWIWLGPSFDPATGEWCDRSYHWRACLDGKQVDIWRVWPACSGHPISGADYNYMLALLDHARIHEPLLPEAAPHDAIDHNKLKVLF